VSDLGLVTSVVPAEAFAGEVATLAGNSPPADPYLRRDASNVAFSAPLPHRVVGVRGI
jgi:hypothetical protein